MSVCEAGGGGGGIHFANTLKKQQAIEGGKGYKQEGEVK